MDLLESILPESLGGKTPDLIVGVLTGLLATAIWAIFTDTGRRVLGFFGIRPKPTEVVVVPNPEAVETRAASSARPRLATLKRPTEHYIEDPALLSEIMAALGTGGPAPIVTLYGMGGIGKTEAAVIAATDMVEREGAFRDGVIFIDLLGFHPSRDILQPMDALRALIKKAGGAEARLQGDGEDDDTFVDELSDDWRALIAGRDRLVILDNARDKKQIERLIPSRDGPPVLITSRDVITVTGQTAVIEIPRMDDERAGEMALAWTPDLSEQEVGRLVAAALGLPLLVETIATLIAESTDRSAVAWLTDVEEAGAAADLPEIEKVKARLGVSINALDEENRTRYAALSLFPAGFHAKSAYGLWGLEEAPGARALGRLRRRSLLIPVESDFEELFDRRYRLHDYLQAVAAERFRALAQEERTGFRHRWGQEALKLLASANELYGTKGGDLAGLRLFEQEQGTIAAVQDWAAARAGEDDVAADLAMRFPNFSILNLRLTPQQWIDWLEAGLSAAQRLHDRRGEAVILGNLGHRLQHLGDLDAAEARHKQSLAIETELGNKKGMAQDYGNLGIVYGIQEKYEDAEAAFKAGLKIQEGEGNRESAAKQYGNLGNIYHLQERFDEAEAMYLKSLEITENLGLREVSANQYGNLGSLYGKQGKLDQAGEAVEKQLAINTKLGRRDGIATANFNLAILRLQQGGVTDPRKHAETARALFAEMGMDQEVAKAEALLAEIEALMRG